MSSFVVGKKTLNIIYCGLDEYIFKNTWSSTTDELREILKKGGFEFEDAQDLTNIFYKLNQVATGSRYNENLENGLDEMPKGEFRKSLVELPLVYKCLACLRYQASEELKIINYNHAYTALNKIINIIAEKIAHKASQKFDIWGD